MYQSRAGTWVSVLNSRDVGQTPLIFEDATVVNRTGGCEA